VAALTIPPNLAQDVAAAGDETRDAWLADLPDTITALSDRWSLTVGEPYSPGGSCSWVAPVHANRGELASPWAAPGRLASAGAGGRASRASDDAAGTNGQPAELALKVGWSHDESLHEPDGLRAWDGAGVVRLFAAERTGHSSALLLERCVPGATLAESLPETEQDPIVAGLLRRLWIEPADGHPFRPLEVMCDRWADEFEAALEGAPSGCVGRDRPVLDGGVVREGVRLVRELPRTAPDHVLLWTDLHAENILAAQREPWLAIDPKPYVGDPAYDVLQHMLNCPGRLHVDPHALCRRMAALCELDANRVAAWLLARSVIESIEDPALTVVAARLAKDDRP
jgi:streptomycin 6-kinase